MEAGKLRHQVQIQRKAVTADSNFGGMVETWEDLSKPWAEVVPLQGRELVNAQAVNAEVTTRITIRFTDITTADRILFDGKYYNLQSVIDQDLRHRNLVILASEGLNEG